MRDVRLFGLDYFQLYRRCTLYLVCPETSKDENTSVSHPCMYASDQHETTNLLTADETFTNYLKFTNLTLTLRLARFLVDIIIGQGERSGDE